VSVSHTTRKPRAQEIEGQHYYFVSPTRFEELVSAGEFLEHARVFDNCYGTGMAQVQGRLAAGANVILEIDWQGAAQVRRALPGCVSIFILPPSRESLQQRLRARGTDSLEVVERRLRDAVTDMSHYLEFDYVVVNDHFEQALLDLQAILDGHGEGLRADRPALAPLTQLLLR
jgi:guanylate kinase